MSVEVTGEPSAEIPAPDEVARLAALDRQQVLTKPTGALGRLEPLAAWVSAVQGACPPRPFGRVRAVVVAADHGIARAGVSAYPPEVTAQMVANIAAGGAAVNVLGRMVGATVRVVDAGVARPSGSIDRADALAAEAYEEAYALGRSVAEDEVDSGADLLVLGEMGIGNTTPAAAVVAALLDLEPVAVIGRGTGIDDAGWMRKAAAIRDALRRVRRSAGTPAEVLRVAGGADLTALAGLLVQAAVRRTPVVLDGVVVCAAALAAARLAPGAEAWWVAGSRSPEPAQRQALATLGLEPLLDLDLRLGEGTGALLAVPLLQAAAATLAEMATFAEAGVSDRER